MGKAKHLRHLKPIILWNIKEAHLSSEALLCFLTGYSMLLVNDPSSCYKEAPPWTRALPSQVLTKWQTYSEH